MTKEILKSFIRENDFIQTIEYRWVQSDNDMILFVFISNFLIDRWNEILGPNITDEEGINCTMKDGYFVFSMLPILEYFGIYENEEIYKLFPLEESR